MGHYSAKDLQPEIFHIVSFLISSHSDYVSPTSIQTLNRESGRVAFGGQPTDDHAPATHSFERDGATAVLRSTSACPAFHKDGRSEKRMFSRLIATRTYNEARASTALASL